MSGMYCFDLDKIIVVAGSDEYSWCQGKRECMGFQRGFLKDK
jgi:hypothetical protein